MSVFALLFALGGSPQFPPALVGQSPEEQVVMALKGARKQWLNRDWGSHTDDAITALEAAKAADPANYKVRYNLSRFYYWQAIQASGDAKAEWAKKAWDEAEEAKALRPGAVEGWYWASAAIGEYSKAMGIGTAVKDGLADKFKTNAQKAIDINSSHDEGGPLRALGRFHSQLPWPLQDLDTSRRLLEKANGVSRSAINLYFLADSERMDDNLDVARPLFEECAALDPAKAKDPPATRRNTKRCEDALKGL